MKTTLITLSIISVVLFVNILNKSNEIKVLRHKEAELKKHAKMQTKMLMRHAELNIRLNNLCDRFQSSRNAKHQDKEIQDLMFKCN